MTKAITTDHIEYEQAVKEGKKIIGRINAAEWKIAAYACAIEDAYGEKGLRRLARSIDIPLDELKKYRDTGRAFPNQLQMYYDQMNWPIRSNYDDNKFRR